MKKLKTLPFNDLRFITIKSKGHIHRRIIDVSQLTPSIVHTVARVFLSDGAVLKKSIELSRSPADFNLGKVDGIASYYAIREDDVIAILSYFVSNPFIGRYDDAIKVANKFENNSLVFSLRERNSIKYMYENKKIVYKAIKTYMYKPNFSFSEIANYYGWSTKEYQHIIKFAACVLINTWQFNRIEDRLIGDLGYEIYLTIKDFRDRNKKVIHYLDDITTVLPLDNKSSRKLINICQDHLYKAYKNALYKSN